MKKYILALIFLMSLEGIAIASRSTLHKGDVVNITVRKHSNASGSYLIRPDGCADLPFIGEVKMANLSVAELRERLVVLFSEYIINPEISINLKRRHNSKIRYNVNEGL